MLRICAVDVLDVLVYSVVIALFVEYFPDVISESFGITLLTGVLLKLVLEIVLWAKKTMLARLRGAATRRRRLVSAVTLLLLLPGSKFLVLELTQLVFGGRVQLGGFFLVTALIIVLMAARGGMRRLVGREAVAVST